MVMVVVVIVVVIRSLWLLLGHCGCCWVIVVVVAVVVCSHYGIPKSRVGSVVVVPHLDTDCEVIVELPVLSLPALALDIFHCCQCHLDEVVTMSLVWLGEKN